MEEIIPVATKTSNRDAIIVKTEINDGSHTVIAVQNYKSRLKTVFGERQLESKIQNQFPILRSLHIMVQKKKTKYTTENYGMYHKG